MQIYNTSPAQDALIDLGKKAIQMSPYVSLLMQKGSAPGMTECLWCKRSSHSNDADTTRHEESCVWVRAHLALQAEAQRVLEDPDESD